jgi:membrane protein implicated in regulation of membrane protease activity
MPRGMVGLFAAVVATMSALVSHTKGDLVLLAIAGFAAVSGLAAYLGSPSVKKNGVDVTLSVSERTLRDSQIVDAAPICR